MFEKEIEECVPNTNWHVYSSKEIRDAMIAFCRKSAEFGYNKAKEEFTERLDDAAEIIGLMKDLFFDCWQEKGYEAIKFEQRVNNFLKGE